MSFDYRYEIKFVLDNSRYSDAMQWLYNKTTAIEKFEVRKVNSIYFDDVGFSSVRDNLAGISQRKKIRLRAYGREELSTPVFEEKIKNGRLGYKSSYAINSLEGNLLKFSLGEIADACVKDLLSQNIVLDSHLVPTLQVCYEREYYEDCNGIRITIDQDIEFSDVQLHAKLRDSNFLSYPFQIMEIKFTPDMKETVSNLIRSLHITPKRHSKYLVGLAMLGHVTYI